MKNAPAYKSSEQVETIKYITMIFTKKKKDYMTSFTNNVDTIYKVSI